MAKFCVVCSLLRVMPKQVCISVADSHSGTVACLSSIPELAVLWLRSCLTPALCPAGPVIGAFLCLAVATLFCTALCMYVGHAFIEFDY